MVLVERYHGLPHSTSVAVVCLAMRPLGSCRQRFAGAGSKLQSKGPHRDPDEAIHCLGLQLYSIGGFNFTRSQPRVDRSRDQRANKLDRSRDQRANKPAVRTMLPSGREAVRLVALAAGALGGAALMQAVGDGKHPMEMQEISQTLRAFWIRLRAPAQSEAEVIRLQQSIAALRRELRELRLAQQHRLDEKALRLVSVLSNPFAGGEDWWRKGGAEVGAAGGRGNTSVLWRDALLLVAGASVCCCATYAYRALVAADSPPPEGGGEGRASSPHLLWNYFLYQQSVRPCQQGAERVCCICLDSVPWSEMRVLAPCGHRCVCARHGEQLVGKACPLCRALVQHSMLVYD